RAILQDGDEAGQDGRNRVDDIRTGGYSPTIRKRSLSRKLGELRKNCGLTTTQVQLQLNWSASKLNYIEKAKWIEPNSDAVADPGIREDQLSHLIEQGARENVDIRVIPVTAGIYPGAGEVFELLSFPDPAERDFVYLESSFDDRMLEETDEVERYQARFDRLG